jgi:hypothetical protein
VVFARAAVGESVDEVANKPDYNPFRTEDYHRKYRYNEIIK